MVPATGTEVHPALVTSWMRGGGIELIGHFGK